MNYLQNHTGLQVTNQTRTRHSQFREITISEENEIHEILRRSKTGRGANHEKFLSKAKQRNNEVNVRGKTFNFIRENRILINNETVIWDAGSQTILKKNMYDMEPIKLTSRSQCITWNFVIRGFKMLFPTQPDFLFIHLRAFVF